LVTAKEKKKCLTLLKEGARLADFTSKSASGVRSMVLKRGA